MSGTRFPATFDRAKRQGQETALASCRSLVSHRRRANPTGAKARRRRRRGVTLVEMLVTVAVLVIIMTIMVQIFQSATGVLSAAQTIQDLDNQLKLLDSTIRSDLGGATAKFTPSLDPNQNLGYFEYGENEFADLQGEDSDDYLRFTAKAPAGQPFTGRIWVTLAPGATGMVNALAPSPSSHGHERVRRDHLLPAHGNLYRRVLLVAPELQSAIVPAINNTGVFANGTTVTFAPVALNGNTVSWQGVNDVSARPAAVGPDSNLNPTPGDPGGPGAHPQYPGRSHESREPVCLAAIRHGFRENQSRDRHHRARHRRLL